MHAGLVREEDLLKLGVLGVASQQLLLQLLDSCLVCCSLHCGTRACAAVDMSDAGLHQITMTIIRKMSDSGLSRMHSQLSEANSLSSLTEL